MSCDHKKDEGLICCEVKTLRSKLAAATEELATARRHIESHERESEQICGYQKLIKAEARIKELEGKLAEAKESANAHRDAQSGARHG